MRSLAMSARSLGVLRVLHLRSVSFLRERRPHPLPRLLDVTAHRLFSGRRIVRAQRIQEGCVTFGDFAQRMVRLRNGEKRRGGQPHSIPDLLQQPVFRRLDNRQMEGKVGLDR